jgi:hypothetical protein
VVQRRGAEFVVVSGSKPRFTGGHTGIPWGTANVWDEPYDEEEARSGAAAAAAAAVGSRGCTGRRAGGKGAAGSEPLGRPRLTPAGWQGWQGCCRL